MPPPPTRRPARRLTRRILHWQARAAGELRRLGAGDCEPCALQALTSAWRQRALADLLRDESAGSRPPN